MKEESTSEFIDKKEDKEGLSILTSDKDCVTHNISEMGDFFNFYLKRCENKLEYDSYIQESESNILPITIDLLSELLNIGTKKCNGIQYVADFGSLSYETRKKLRMDEMVIQGSKKNPGNNSFGVVYRNKKNSIVENLTLKKVVDNPLNMNVVRNLMVMMQLKQISDKVDSVYDMMRFQIKRQRDRDLLEPFFKARDYIVSAQVTKNDNERVKYLDYAMDGLKSVYQAGYHEIITCAEILSEKTKSPIFRKQKEITQYMIYMSEDVYIVNKCIGLQMLIYDYLGKKEEANATILEYTNCMADLCNKPIGISGVTAIGLLQDNFPYNKNNKDMWFDFINCITELKLCYDGIEDNSAIYMLKLEA